AIVEAPAAGCVAFGRRSLVQGRRALVRVEPGRRCVEPLRAPCKPNVHAAASEQPRRAGGLPEKEHRDKNDEHAEEDESEHGKRREQAVHRSTSSPTATTSTNTTTNAVTPKPSLLVEIGRASCRERVEM